MEYKKISLPDKLCKEASNYIKKVIDWLTETDKINVIDSGTLYILADSYNQYLKATDIINREGMTIPGSRNTIVVHPAVRVAKDNKSIALSIMTEMGLTLKSRNKISGLEKDNEKSPLQNFFSNND